MGLPCHKTISRPNDPHPRLTSLQREDGGLQVPNKDGGLQVPNTDEEQADTDEGQVDRGASNYIEGRANQSQE